ncbi:MAG: hypothetical protein II920_00440 [Clostridia bacterium]|nr:hypothetical protein [Clostridia bacterium]
MQGEKGKNYLFSDSGAVRMLCIAGILRAVNGIILFFLAVYALITGAGADRLLGGIPAFDTFRSISDYNGAGGVIAVIFVYSLIVYLFVLLTLTGVGSIMILARKPGGAGLCRSCYAQLRIFFIVFMVLLDVILVLALMDTSLDGYKSGRLLYTLMLLGALLNTLIVLLIKYYKGIRNALIDLQTEMLQGECVYSSTGSLTGIAIALGVILILGRTLPPLFTKIFKINYYSSSGTLSALLGGFNAMLPFLVAFANIAFRRHIREKSDAKAAQKPYAPSFKSLPDVLGALIMGTFAVYYLYYFFAHTAQAVSDSYYLEYYWPLMLIYALLPAAFILFCVGLKSRFNPPLIIAGGIVFSIEELFYLSYLTFGYFSYTGIYFDWSNLILILQFAWAVLLVIAGFIAVSRRKAGDPRPVSWGLRLPMLIILALNFILRMIYTILYSVNIATAVESVVSYLIFIFGLTLVTLQTGRTEKRALPSEPSDLQN